MNLNSNINIKFKQQHQKWI